MLKVSDVARILNIHEQTVYRMAADKRLPSLKVGRNVRIDEADLQAYIEQQKGA